MMKSPCSALNEGASSSHFLLLFWRRGAGLRDASNTRQLNEVPLSAVAGGNGVSAADGTVHGAGQASALKWAVAERGGNGWLHVRHPLAHQIRISNEIKYVALNSIL